MPESRRNVLASYHMDVIRGAAAFAVLAYHIRYRFFLDYSDLAFVSPATKAFYAATSFGHDAVMVFFVLSGYLISSSVLRDVWSDKWSWSKYASNRLIRLYVVLLPGLLLTMLWDGLGIHLFESNAIYSGARQQWSHDFFNVSGRLDASTLIGNLMFLQTITVPPLGSNDPLWSLAYEFWYYVLFPVIVVGIAVRKTIFARLAYIAIAALIAAFVGKGILLYFPIWLLGAAVFLLPRLAWLEVGGIKQFLIAICSAVLFIIATVLGHVGDVRETLGNSTLVTDYMTGCGFAVMLYVLLHDSRPSQGGWYELCASKMANVSYTLYVVHMPLLVFVRAWLIEDEPWHPDWWSLYLASLIGMATLGYAILIATVTEARTEWIRGVICNNFLPWLGVGQLRRVSLDSGQQSIGPLASIAADDSKPNNKRIGAEECVASRD